MCLGLYVVLFYLVTVINVTCCGQRIDCVNAAIGLKSFWVGCGLQSNITVCRFMGQTSVGCIFNDVISCFIFIGRLVYT